MHKHDELRKSKLIALGFFVGAAVLFVVSLLLPQTWWTGLLRAFSEAAMVGALADWFAVVALFRRIPIPIISRHTAIIPGNKDKIADNLALFVREKFLDTESIVGLIRRHDPVQMLADWLAKPANTELMGAHLVRAATFMLDFIEDAPVQNVIRRAVHTMVGSVDLSKSSSAILAGLTRGRRHQQLLDEGIRQIARLMDNPETQGAIADGIVDWLKEDYAFLEKMLPSELIGRKGADIAVRLASGVLNKVAADPAHPLRERFDDYVAGFIERLKVDPEFIAKADDVKRYLLEDDTFNGYVGSLWAELKAWLKRDLERDDSSLRRRIIGMGAWIGKALGEDALLRQSLQENLEAAARGVAPEFAGYLTRHIADTVKQWDDREMSAQIELNIGKDLQYIRINGTIVGGMIGVILYLLSHLPALLR
ncbi:DUF445 family protein [Massilia aurea]|uniref:DUF445 domain-containing protein n=1 Tax=Massilia aurea TaxID=373040 RepID=UPI003462A47C